MLYMRGLTTATLNFMTYGRNPQIKIVKPDRTLFGTEKIIQKALEKTYDPEIAIFLHFKILPHSQRECIG